MAFLFPYQNLFTFLKPKFMSARQQKDKRTKEQILKLLDRAMEQEERLSEKIKSLETDLADCRKKAEDPRHELTEEAMPASKVSFRIDYYRTSDESPLKGIIEHLPSRQIKSFEGEGQKVIGHFVNRFLTEESEADVKQKTLVNEKTELPAADAKGEEEKKTIEKAVQNQEEETITSGSQLLQRLRAEFAAQNQRTSSSITQPQTPPPPQRSERTEHLLAKARAASSPPSAQQRKPMQQQPSSESQAASPQGSSRLLERLLEEHRKNLKSS